MPRYASSEGHEKTEPCNKIIQHLKTKCSLTFDEKESTSPSTGIVWGFKLYFYRLQLPTTRLSKQCQNCQNVFLESFGCFWRISRSVLTGNPVSQWIVQTHSYPGHNSGNGGNDSNFRMLDFPCLGNIRQTLHKSFVEETWKNRLIQQIFDAIWHPWSTSLQHFEEFGRNLPAVTSCYIKLQQTLKESAPKNMNKCLARSLLEVCDSSMSSCNPGSMTCTWGLTMFDTS